MKINILEDLNDSQRAAVEYCDGPSLVIAGAGSGKTRVLTYKIAYLLDRGMMAWNILALTFTNKAANEMRKRIAGLVGESTARYLHMGTFHSVFSRILRAEAELLGYGSNFTIYDENDSRSLIKNIVKELNLDDKKYKPAALRARISMAKNRMITPRMYANDREAERRDYEDRMPDVAMVYRAYGMRCRQANAMDFDDLLMNTCLLFSEHPEVLAKYAERFHFILVDEYQDTNFVQQQILLQLTRNNRNICVVGDDAQSIYGFRGADINNILSFSTHYENAKLFKLERNYRSTQMIVQAANSLIKHNERQIHKDIYSRNDKGERVMLKSTYSDKEEALVVCGDIKRIMRQTGCSYNDFAILYRTNAQSRSFEEQMRKANIPYRIVGGLSFYQRKEIKDIIAYFRLVTNPDDEEAFRRIINYPARGIGNTSLARIISCANENGVSLWKVITGQEHFVNTGISKSAQTKINDFTKMIKSFVERADTEDAFVLGRDIMRESGMISEIYSDSSPENQSRQENIQEFTGSLKDFVENRKEEGREDEIFLSDFLQEVSLLSDIESEDDGKETSRVTLMTIHSAKGLEFPTVFVVGLEENIFPSPLSCSSKRAIEEERRLFYVAITRAEKRCILTWAKNRFRYGKIEFGTPSRFLHEISPSLLNTEGETDKIFDNRPEIYNTFSRMQNSKPVASQFKADEKEKITDFANDDNNVSAGSVIEHQRFGIGTVLNVEGTGENTKATVVFKNAGTKQLLLKFARFKVIGKNVMS